MLKVFKVSSKSDPGKLAGAIAGTINEGDEVRLECIGAGAVNNAVKGIATARGFVASAGVDLLLKPYFKNVEIEEQEKTAIIFNVVCLNS